MTKEELKEILISNLQLDKDSILLNDIMKHILSYTYDMCELQKQECSTSVDTIETSEYMGFDKTYEKVKRIDHDSILFCKNVTINDD